MWPNSKIVCIFNPEAQWKAASKEFGSSSALHRRFLQWVKAEVFVQMLANRVKAKANLALGRNILVKPLNSLPHRLTEPRLLVQLKLIIRE